MLSSVRLFECWVKLLPTKLGDKEKLDKKGMILQGLGNLKDESPSFSGLSSIEDPENFVKELKKVFDVMYVVCIERVELDAYQIKSVSMTWYE